MWGCPPGRRRYVERQGCAAAWLWATPRLSLVWTRVYPSRWWDAPSREGDFWIGWGVKSSCRFVSLCLNTVVFAYPRIKDAPIAVPPKQKIFSSTGAKRSKMGFYGKGTTRHCCHPENHLFYVSLLWQMTGERVTSLPWKLLFSWPIPIWLLLGLFFMKKGWSMVSRNSIYTYLVSKSHILLHLNPVLTDILIPELLHNLVWDSNLISAFLFWVPLLGWLVSE